MKSIRSIINKTPAATKYRYKMIGLIAIGWTALDILYLLARLNLPGLSEERNIFDYSPVHAILLRGVIVFIMSGIMASLLLFQAPKHLDSTLIFNFAVKTAWLILLALLMNCLIHLSYSLLMLQHSMNAALDNL